MQCTSGSTKQSGAPTFFQFDTSTVTNFLPFGASVAWIAFVGLPVGPVDTADFCSREPPDTTMSAGDWIALAFPAIAGPTGAYARFGDWIQQKAFSTYCACNSSSATPYSAEILSLSPYWYLKLGESAGPLAADSSGHGRTGGYYNTPVYGQPALMTGDSATSIKTDAGTMSRTTSGTAENWVGASSSSLEFWTKPANPPATAALYTTYHGGNGFVVIDMDTTGHLRLRCRDSTGVTVLSTAYTAASITDGHVHQIDVVLDGSAHTLTVYVDAVSALQITGLNSLAYMDNLGTHYFHDDPSGTNVKVPGYLGQVSWFSGLALSAVTISDNKAAAGGLSIYNPPIYTPPTDGTPGAGTPPVCASYQDICNQLQTTDYLLQGVALQLTQFKTRIQPSFWRTGTIHTGLTGTGFITVSDILGVNVLLTTVPVGWGSTSETPRRLIPSAGSIQSAFAAEYSDNWQLHYENQIIMLQSTWGTQLRYNLRAGVIATIIELLPGY